MWGRGFIGIRVQKGLGGGFRYWDGVSNTFQQNDLGPIPSEIRGIL